MRDSLDTYDQLPEDMIRYLRYYGRHFNKKLCDYAVSKMKPSYKSHSRITKESLESLKQSYAIQIEGELHDDVYVANMAVNDFYGSSLEDDRHILLYVKDVLGDKDGYDGLVFNRWYADMCRKGIPIDWELYV